MNDSAPSASLEMLRQRADALRRIRSFFDERGFLEVETPLLSHDTVVDRHLDPFPVPATDQPAAGEPQATLWLQTSPEFCMKRLLAAGAHAIYQVTRAFRREESGALHNPEFTIVEWYRAGDGMQAGMDWLAELATAMLGCRSVRRVTYRNAFLDHVGVDPHVASVVELRGAAQRWGVEIPVGFTPDERDDWLDLLLSERIASPLSEEPTILHDYPASQAMLARIRPTSPAVAERFELYFKGIELANGYHELLDAEELRRRSETVNRKRLADGKPPLPVESRLLAAMQAGLPSCCGVALGFDRLLMAMTGSTDIRQVIAFPFDRA